MVWAFSLFTDEEIILFAKGKLFYSHEKFGSHFKINPVVGKPQ